MRAIDNRNRALYILYNDAIRVGPRVVAGEQRWHAIGAVEGAVLLVVHVYLTENENGEEETIRIISAREANRRERRSYVRQAGE